MLNSKKEIFQKRHGPDDRSGDQEFFCFGFHFLGLVRKKIIKKIAESLVNIIFGY